MTFDRYDEQSRSLLERCEREGLNIQDVFAAALREMAQEWRPIESAPKGKVILLFAVTDRKEDGSITNWKMATGHTPFAGEIEWMWDGHRLNTWDVKPTHWQPLPPPPADTGEMSGCAHSDTTPGPDVPRVYGTWASEICQACGMWRTMTHRVKAADGRYGAAHHYSDWHLASELAQALERDDDR